MSDPVRMIRSAENSGSVTYHGRKKVELTRPDGSPLVAGEIKAGDIITFDPDTGVIISIKPPQSKENPTP